MIMLQPRFDIEKNIDDMCDDALIDNEFFIDKFNSKDSYMYGYVQGGKDVLNVISDELDNVSKSETVDFVRHLQHKIDKLRTTRVRI